MGFNPTTPTQTKITATFSDRDGKPLLSDKRIDGLFKNVEHLTLKSAFSVAEQQQMNKSYHLKISIKAGFQLPEVESGAVLPQDNFRAFQETIYMAGLGNRKITDTQADFNCEINLSTVHLYGDAQKIEPEFNPPSWTPTK
jgi:hypothetical protein